MKLPKNFNIIGTELYDYQLDSFLFTLQRPSSGLLLDMGLGKSLCAITTARYHIQFNNISKILVVCPTSVLYNWQKEIKKFSEYDSLILHAHSKEERLFKTIETPYTFGILNYEGLYPLLRDMGVIFTPTGKKTFVLASDYQDLLKQIGLGMIIFDESARFIKNHDARRTICSIVLSDVVPYKLILTGTPIANRPLDVWSQFRVLDGGKTFGKDFYAFRGFYFYKYPNTNWGKYYVKKDKTFLLTSKIYSVCIRKKKEEVLKDLPKQLYSTIVIKMDDELRKLYVDVKRQIISEIETAEGTATLVIPSILAKLLRLQQITAGFTVKDNTIVELIQQPKLDALIEQIEIITEQEESVIIWCRFIKSISMIAERLSRLGIKHVTMSGQDKDKEKYDKWKGFQQSKNTNVFIGQVESGGIGIELFKMDSQEDKTQYTIFYENTFSLDVRVQAKSRVHRIGQKSTCMYTDLIVEDSIDEFIIKTLEQKKNVADMILEGGVDKLKTEL